ncbi:MAG TPA: MraY family glycosyltransferase [Sedimentisphaerales bacterium]|nr:MraY family glycosyltransferase [Sedimentisphaerales bacterium]
MILDELVGPARPLTWVVKFWPVIISSFIVAYGATWLCKKIAIKFGIVDKPDNLVKTHKEPVAYLGGIGILVGLIFGVMVGINCLLRQECFHDSFKLLCGILAGATIACVVGLIDDIFNIRPRQKILGQILAAAALLVVGIGPNLDYYTGYCGVTIPISVEIALEAFIVVFFVLGATNSLNLLDGLDGLCGGVTAIITVAMLIVSVHLATWGFSDVGDPVRIILCLALVGGVLGFLPFNRHPAKIFMGDAGSMLLGFVTATLMILMAERIPRWWMASIVVFGLPILDTAVALVRRLINHRPLFVSDRGHIYDQMIDRGHSLKKTVVICYLLAGLYALTGIVMSQIRTRYAAVVYVLVFLISALVIWRKGFLKMHGLRGAVQKED